MKSVDEADDLAYIMSIHFRREKVASCIARE